MKSIIVVGSINMDLVLKVNHFPSPGETILSDDYQTFPGGKGANQAIALSRLGANVSMIGCVGDDVFGKQLLCNLQLEMVNTSKINAITGTPSGIALITVDDTGQNSIVVASGANHKMSPLLVSNLWQENSKPDAVLLQLEIPIEIIEETVNLAHRDRITVVLNAAPFRKLPNSIIQNIDVLIVNESEAALITELPVDNIEQAKKRIPLLLERGPGIVIITLGDKGALLGQRGFPPILISGFLIDAVDTTATGDAFVAAFTYQITAGNSLESAVLFANAAGALTATKIGAQTALPTLTEILNFMESNQIMKEGYIF